MELIMWLILFIIFLFYLYFLSPAIITFKKLISTAITPTRSYHKAACWDVYSIEDKSIPPGQWREFRTGITYAPWPHFYIKFLNITLTPLGNIAYKIHTRSGLASRKGIRCHLGVLDNDYRNELTVFVFNHRQDYPVRIHAGERLAQIEFFRVLPSFLIEKKKLSSSLRGNKGLGSTGA